MKPTEIIREMERDMFLHSGDKDAEIKTLDQFKCVVWNMFNSERYMSRMSYNDYSEVMDVLLNRLKEHGTNS